MPDIVPIDNVPDINLLSKELKKIRNKKTPANVVKVREGKKGKQFKYIDRSAVLQWLDSYYPVWSFEANSTSFREYAGWCAMEATLSVVDPLSGILRRFTCVGQSEISFKRDGGDPVMNQYMKNCETDALKRCCVLLGGFNDVYSDMEDTYQDDTLTEKQQFIVDLLPSGFERIARDEEYSMEKFQRTIAALLLGKVSAETINEAFKYWRNNV